MAYSFVNKNEVNSHIGDSLEQDIPTVEIIKELTNRYHFFYILPKAASYGGDHQILSFWRALLGQNVLELDDSDAVCETIAITIGMLEGSIDLSIGVADLRELGAGDRTVHMVTAALEKMPAGLEKAKNLSGLHFGY